MRYDIWDPAIHTKKMLNMNHHCNVACYSFGMAPSLVLTGQSEQFDAPDGIRQCFCIMKLELVLY